MFSIRFTSLVASVVTLVVSLAHVATPVLTVATLVALATPTLAQIQPPKVEWEKTYNGRGVDWGGYAEQTHNSDGNPTGYIITGTIDVFGGPVSSRAYLIKTDPLGDPLWRKSFAGFAWATASTVHQTEDGGYILAGETASAERSLSIYLVKTNASGDPEWERFFLRRCIGSGDAVQQTNDGGYILVGDTSLMSAGGDDIYLLKTDSAGLVEWEETYGGKSNDAGYSVQQTTEGGYIVAGETSSMGAGARDVYLVKTDAAGNLEWEKTFGETNSDAGYSVQQTDDNGYILVGTTLSFGSQGDIYVVRADSTGKLVWQNNYGGFGTEDGVSVQQTSDDGFIIAGSSSTFGDHNEDTYLIKTGAAGDLVWQKTIDLGVLNQAWNRAASVRLTSDGGFIVAGTVYRFDDAGDFYLVKLVPDVPPPPPCSPDAEAYDEMQTELSHNIEVFGLGRVCTADLTGTIGVKRYLPYVDSATGLRTINTKITKLELTGTDPACGEIKISLNPSLASGGKVVEQRAGTCFPADSFFDVFIQVQIPGQRLLANCKAATMRCTVSALPPVGCVYQLGTGFDVLLYDATAVAGQAASLDCTSPGNSLANIVAADHKPTVAEGPPRVIPPSTRVQLNLFHQNQWLPLTEQVRKDYFQPTLPCVVIVHGWNSELINPLPIWTNQVAATLAAHPKPHNILAWDWQAEAKGKAIIAYDLIGLREAAPHAGDQSSKLARALQQLFNTSGFAKPIHLMGHSLGAFLVAFTGLQLQDPGFGNGIYPVANVTLWDPPERVPFPVIGLVRVPNSLANNVPILRRLGTYVDCFSGTFNDRTYFANVWYVVPGGGHDTYRWYREHTLRAMEPKVYPRLDCTANWLTGTVGFGASLTHANPSRQLKFTCLLAELDVSLVSHSRIANCNLPNVYDEFAFAQYCIAGALPDPSRATITVRINNGIGNLSCDCRRPTELILRMRLRRPGGAGGQAEAGRPPLPIPLPAGEGGPRPGEGGGQAEVLTATYALPLTVAPKWDYVSFTYRIEAAPAPATVTLSIQDGNEVVPLWLATSDTDLGELADSGLLNITPYHGKEVSLIFSLSSIEPDAIVEVSNLTLVQGPFHDNVAPVANAGADRAVAVTDPISTAVSLDGSGTTDPNGDPLVYVWTATQDPAVAEQEGIIAVGVQPTVELPLGGYQFTLHARDPFDGFSSDDVIVEVEYPFSRGDANADGKRNITDAIATLNWLFNDTGKTLCKDAADTNDDDVVNIADASFTLGFLFLGTKAPDPPFPGVGLDPTPDLLGCTLQQP